MANQIMAAFPSEESRSTAIALLRSEGFSAIDVLPVTEQDWPIVVQAPFGRAARAVQIVKSSGAHDIREDHARSGRASAETVAPSETRHAIPPDQSFFVSSALGLPLLLDNPAPLSRLLGLPTLIRDPADGP